MSQCNALSTQSLRRMSRLLLLPLSLTISIGAWAVSEGEVAPVTQIESIRENGEIDLQDLSGQVVLVDFWASWCPPCRKSLPLFNELRNQLEGRGFEVFAINVDEDKNDGIRLFNQLKVDYESGLDPEGVFAEKWDVQAMPTSFLVDKKGIVRLVHKGFKEKDIAHLKGEIIKLINE